MTNREQGAGSREQKLPLFRSRRPLAGLVLVLTIALLTTYTSASELQWRRGGPKHKPSTTAKPATVAKPAPVATPVAAKPMPAKRATAKKSNAAHSHRDRAVAPAAFEEEEVTGPMFATHEAGEATMRSIVVRESAEEPQEPFRAAQLQFREPTDNRYEDPLAEPPAPTNDELQVEVEEGFSEEESLPPMPSTEGFDEDLRTPSQDEFAPLPDSDVEIKRRQLEQRPNLGRPEPYREEPAIGPRGTDAFGEMQRREEFPDSDVDPKILAEEEQRADEDCNAALERLRGRRLADVNLNIAVDGTQGEDFPFECSIDAGEMYGGRCWCDTTYMWKASALCHKPLYFEDEALERYGHSWGPCLDPIVSGAHFFCKLPVLPYCMGVTPPTECVYALGHYRPGNCAPYLIDPVPLSCRGAAFQAGAATGAAFVIP